MCDLKMERSENFNDEELNKKNISEKEIPWTIINSYFSNQHLKQLIRHQIESYNDFISRQIPHTIEMFNPVLITSEQDYNKELKKYGLEVYINFENFSLHRPQIHENNGAAKIMFPHEARLRNFTYASNMTVDLNIKYIVRTGEELENVQTYYKVLPKIHIGKLPIMLRSNICVLSQYKHLTSEVIGECKMDPGGYFIINGSEKTCLGQERAAENQIYCFDISKNNSKWSYMAEIKSVPDWKCISPKQIAIMMSSKNNSFGYGLWIQIPRLKNQIPVVILFRALGVISDKEICEKIVLDLNNPLYEVFIKEFKASIIEGNNYLDYESAMKYITGNVMYTPMNMDKEQGAIKKREFAEEVLENDLFPHCHNKTQKIYFLGYMIFKLFKCYLKLAPVDDRDSYINKRIDLTGTLLNNLFRNYLNKLVKDMQKYIVREINTGSWKSSEDYSNIINLTNIYKIIKSTTIENGIKRALATGDFGIKQTNSNKVGVAQVLNRLTYISSLSHLRRINTPIDKSGKLVPPRKLHNSSWGFLCCAETPEGASVGVVKNLSYMSTITINSNSTPLLDCVNLEITKIEHCKDNLDNYVKVFINGAWIGITDEPEKLYLSLKDKKYKGIINIYTSVIFDYKNCEIRVCNDGGRLVRPLLKVNNNNILYTPEIINKLEKQELNWNDLLIACNIDDSIIEYIDPLEQSFSMIAMKKKDLITSKKNNIIYKYTHCEIHPSSIFGILASCIPFPDHNQSPRNTYQCLDINTPVLMKDQSYKLIKDIKVGDYVQTFNPKTMQTSYTKIINQYVRKTDKSMYNVRTYSGKEFNATLDHKFMTYNGWKEVKDLVIDEDLLGIKPALKEMNNIIEENDIQLIFDSNNFRNILTQDNEGKNINENLVNKYISELENNGLLPLYNNNNKLHILARMYGYALADGTLTYHNRDKTFMLQVDFGDNCGAELFELDIEDLGFKKMKIKEGTRLFNGSKYHTFNVAHQNVVGALFKALGMVSGKKTIQYSNDIPNWIKNGTDLVKREFLSGIQGGDGCQIRFNKLDKKGYNYILGPLSMTKNFEHKNSLIKMMTTISDMFNYFKIVNSVFCNLNTNEDDRYIIGIQFSSSQENLINYFDTIGYKYDIRKITKSGIIIEYLKYKKTIIKEYTDLIKEIRNYHDKNQTNRAISSKLNIDINRVSDIIKSYKKNRKITCPNLKNNNIEEFVNKCKIINDTIFVPIKSKKLIDMNIISDITTESDNHSFFINDGIMTHNSAMGKQAMGVYVTNYEKRMDKTAYVLSYPMRPLVDTRIMNIINLNKIPSGEMVIVAIASHTGYNQEDSILFNKGSLDRGLFQATVYHTEKDEDKKIQGDEEIRCKPDPNKTKGMKFANYDKVDQNGVIPENSLVEDRHIIISKVLPIKENRNDHTKVIKYEDQSKVYRTKEETYIDKNYIERNGDGYNFCKVRLRIVRKPVIGDKFCIRENALILTDYGWISLKEIDINKHKVATLKNNKELDYVYAVEKYEFDCVNEELYCIKSQQVHMVCTKEHKLYIKKRDHKDFEFIEAKNAFGKMVRYKKDVVNIFPDQQYINFKTITYPMDSWLKLLGIYISDGWSDDKAKCINLCGLKNRKKEFINSTCNELGIEYSIYEQGITISGYKYSEIFDNLINKKSYEKYLPDYVWSLSQRQSRILLDSLMRCDGHTYTYKGEPSFQRYGTTSLQLAEDIQRLAFTCGWSGIIKLDNSSLGITRVGTRNLGKRAGERVEATQTHNYYKISIITKQNNPWVNKKTNYTNKEDYIKFTGKVGCIEVPDTHLFYYKEDIYSPPVWTGNSSRHK